MSIPPTPVLSIKRTLDLSRVELQGQADRIRSNGIAQAVYADNRAALSGTTTSGAGPGQFSESWSALTNWTGSSGTVVAVSGGRMIANAGGAASGINHGLTLAATDTARIVVPVNIINTGGGGLGVGVSQAASGAAPGSAGANCRGVWFAVGTALATMDNTTVTNSIVAAPSGVYIVTIDIGINQITVTLVNTGGSAEVVKSFARTTAYTQNIWLFNSTTGGSSVGPLTAVMARSSATPRTGIEGLARTVCRETIGNNTVKAELPANWDPRVPTPAIIQFHGNASDQDVFATNTAQKDTLRVLCDAGFIVLSATNSNTASWGIDASLDAYTQCYQWARDNFNISSVGLFGNSMGGIESLLVLAQARIPGIAAWVGHSPTTNLADCYANATFTSVIDGSYGISGDYAVKTAGHDPNLMPGWQFRGTPMLFLAATDDTTVPKTIHTDVFAAKVAPFCPEATVVAGITGGHSFSIAAYTTTILTFFRKYLGNLV